MLAVNNFFLLLFFFESLGRITELTAWDIIPNFWDNCCGSEYNINCEAPSDILIKYLSQLLNICENIADIVNHADG